MVTINSAENALKTVYLGVLSNQLNLNINPFLAKIKNSTKDVWGKDVRKLAPIGINGGIGAGTEEGTLPAAASNNYLNFVSELKNLYGTIELSDKAIRASENNVGAFVNLLNDEMEGLIKAATFNFGRMIYGDGSGKLGTVASVSENDKFITLDTGFKNIIEGMVIDIYNGNSLLYTSRITAIDRTAPIKAYLASVTFSASDEDLTNLTVYVSGSKDKELTGLAAIFDTSKDIYGVNRSAANFCLCPVSKASTTISDTVMQEVIDTVEERNGSTIDFIATTAGVRRKYQEYLNTNKRNVDIMDLAGGFKAISYNGIPVMVDRFCPTGTCNLLNSKEFTIHQLCDWRWLEGDNGRILKQMANKPTYCATLVKYAELICDLPGGQARITGITE